MHRFRPIRPFRSARALVAAAAVPVLVVAVMLPGTASAGKPKALKGTCTSLSGNALGTPIPTLNGCSPTPNADSPGTFTFPFASSGTSVIHWANGSSSTFSFSSKTTLPTKVKKGATVPNSKFHCPSGDQVEAALKGKITGNSGLPSGDTGMTGPVKATVCVAANYDLSLLAGTSFSL